MKTVVHKGSKMFGVLKPIRAKRPPKPKIPPLLQYMKTRMKPTFKGKNQMLRKSSAAGTHQVSLRSGKFGQGR